MLSVVSSIYNSYYLTLGIPIQWQLLSEFWVYCMPQFKVIDSIRKIGLLRLLEKKDVKLNFKYVLTSSLGKNGILPGWPRRWSSTNSLKLYLLLLSLFHFMELPRVVIWQLSFFQTYFQVCIDFCNVMTCIRSLRNLLMKVLWKLQLLHFKISFLALFTFCCMSSLFVCLFFYANVSPLSVRFLCKCEFIVGWLFSYDFHKVWYNFKFSNFVTK